LKLKDYLLEINHYDDVRTVNRKHFKIYKYCDHNSSNSLLKVLFPSLSIGLNLSLD